MGVRGRHHLHSRAPPAIAVKLDQQPHTRCAWMPFSISSIVSIGRSNVGLEKTAVMAAKAKACHR